VYRTTVQVRKTAELFNIPPERRNRIIVSKIKREG
jgi:hypothetical protein